jgi:hypothetical protein
VCAISVGADGVERLCGANGGGMSGCVRRRRKRSSACRKASEVSGMCMGDGGGGRGW